MQQFVCNFVRFFILAIFVNSDLCFSSKINSLFVDPLVDRKNIILPPLHIKLGLMKQFVKSFDRSGDSFRNICSTFTGLSYKKNKAGIFDGPQIRFLIRDQHFVDAMTVVEASAWKAFSKVVHNFQGNKKADNLTII